MELILSSGHNFSEYQCYATKINKGRWAGKDRIKVEKWNVSRYRYEKRATARPFQSTTVGF
jgi:hypothetical protein